RAVVITHLDLRGDEVVRTDTVLVEVLRGELASLEARIPDGLRVESARMDDGGEVAVTGGLVSGRRKQRLSGNGFLKLVSRLSGPPAATMPLSAVEPAIPVRARYLVVSSSIAASLRPVPAEAWSTIDLTDPPDSLERELQERPPVGGWRLESTGVATALEVALLPPADLRARHADLRQRGRLAPDPGPLPDRRAAGRPRADPAAGPALRVGDRRRRRGAADRARRPASDPSRLPRSGRSGGRRGRGRRLVARRGRLDRPASPAEGGRREARRLGRAAAHGAPPARVAGRRRRGAAARMGGLPAARARGALRGRRPPPGAVLSVAAAPSRRERQDR